MPSNKPQLRVVSRSSRPGSRAASPQPPTVSPQWLLRALGFSAIAALFCAWATLCLLFWQGSWQLLYHPAAAVTRTPATVGLHYEPVGFAATETGQLRLQGWWIPAADNAPFARFTVLYLHGATGNLGNTVEALARLHAAGVNVFAFDYRGYGLSRFVRPSEAGWLQDAAWAIHYLTATRNIDPRSIVLDGDGLGANLALEAASANSHLGGVVLESPIENPVSVIFGDARAHLVPAHLLVHDRFDLGQAAAALHLPSLWILSATAAGAPSAPAAFAKVTAPKQLVWMPAGADSGNAFTGALIHWLASLPN
jgi:pimeloyl-ACP methyl ester carboxylesterase